MKKANARHIYAAFAGIPVYGQNCSPMPNKIMLFKGGEKSIQLTVIWKVSFKHPSQVQFPFKKIKNHRISISADTILSLCSCSSKDRTSNSTLNNQWAQWEQLMNPQPHRKKGGKPLQTSTGVLRRLQSHLGEAGLPVVWWVYEKLLRNTTSELFQSTFHNYMICTTVLKVWHIIQIQQLQSVTQSCQCLQLLCFQLQQKLQKLKCTERLHSRWN